MARFSSKNRFIQDFGGVALADILANGVVVLLVVIILTISFKRQQTEQQIEQSVEISAILARDIASSLVFNDLPSSPPAILHDYHCRAPRGPWRNHYEQHDCMPWLYPIFEIHQNHIREFNSQRVFSRSQLLEEDNELDAYLRLLTPAQKVRSRIDIYDVDMYYLALSILRENGVQPGHWHFLGEKQKPPAGGSLADFIGDGDGEEKSTNTSLGDDIAEGEQAPQEATQESQLNEPQDTEQQLDIPADTSLRAPDLIEEMLPPSDTLSRGGEEYNQRQELESEFSTDEEASYSDALAEALANAILDEEQGESSSVFGVPSSLQIRIPSSDGQENALSLPAFIESLSEGEGEPIDYHIFMIIYLLEYIHLVEELGFDRVDANQLITQLLGGAVDFDTHPYRPFAERLREKMKQAFEAEEGLVTVGLELCDHCETQLFMSPNEPVTQVQLYSINDQHSSQIPFVNTEMRLYPYPDSGEFTEIFKGDTLLIHPQSIAQGGKRWYVTAILDPNIEDVVIGYVYAEDNDESLSIYADVNSLRLAGQQLLTSLPIFPLRDEVILSIVYGSMVFFIILIFFLLLRGFFRRAT